jgi:hypothetical protein
MKFLASNLDLVMRGERGGEAERRTDGRAGHHELIQFNFC